MKTISRNLHHVFCLFALSLGLASAPAAEIRKAYNGDPLDQGSSWIGGIAPTNTDVALWDADSIPSGSTPFLDLNWQGIRWIDGANLGTLTIPGGTYTLTLGDAGIDMSDAGALVDFYCPYISLGSNQVWNIGPGRVVTQYSENGPGSGALHKTGAGTLSLYYSTAASHLNNTAPLGLAGGTVQWDGLAHSEVVSSAQVYGDATRVQRVGGGTLVLNNITRSVGGTVDFAQAGIALTSTPNDSSENGGILGGWATVNGQYWAQAATGGGNQPITDFPTFYSVDFLPDRNVNLPYTPGGYTITNTTGLAINSLRFDGDQTLTVGTNGAFSLTNLSGGILMGGGAIQAAIVSSSPARTLRGPPGGDLIFHVPMPGQFLSNQIVIADNAGCGLTKSGTGTLVLDQGTNNSFTGQTTINSGTLLTGGVNLRRYVSTNLLINPNGTYLHGSGDLNLLLTAITLNGGVLNLNGAGDSCASLLLLNNGLITGHSPNKSLSAGSALVPVDARWGTVDVRLTAPGGLTKTTDRKVIFRRNSSIFDTVRIEHGIIQVGSNATLTADSFVLGNGTNSGRLVLGETNGMGGYPGYATITTSNLVAFNGTGTANAIVSGCGTGGQFSALILNFSGATNFDAGLLGGPWPDENYLGLTKSGLGVLTLTGVGNYYGFTSNSTGSGTLKIGSTNAIPSGTVPVQKGYVAATSGTFDLNGLNLGIAGLFGNGTVTSSTGSAVTLTFRESGNGTFNGSLNDGVAGISVVQNGSGLQVFGGNNTYAGTTTINSGSIGVAGNGVIGNGTGTIFLAGGNLNLSGSRDPFTSPISNPITLLTNGAITSPGGFHQFSGLLSGSVGTLTLRYEGIPSGGLSAWFSAPFAFNRPIVIDNGTGANTIFVSGNTNGTTQTYNGNISGSGTFHRGVDSQPQVGGGMTILNGNNSYLGQTRVYDGTLVVNGAISNSHVIVHTNATLAGNGIIGGYTQIIEGATLSPGTSVGRLNIYSLSLYPGSTTIMELNGSTNDMVTGLNDITYSGTLVLSNLGPALVAGNSFKLFSFTNYINSFGTSFTKIVPATPGSGLVWDTSSLVTNGIIRVATAPRFDGTTLSGTNLVLSGSGGPTNGSYYVLASTNVAWPLTNWVFLSTNTFDGNGNFVFTNAVSPGIPQRFFLLRLP